MRNRAWTRVVAAASGVGLALTIQGTAADAAARVQVSTTSFVLADGAAVAVPVRVSCDPGTRPSLNVQISQRSGRQVASAFGGETDLVCDGTTQEVQVIVHAGNLAFSKGVAFVTANLFACNLGGLPIPFPGSLFGTGCTAKASRTTRLVPGIIPDGGQL